MNIFDGTFILECFCVCEFEAQVDDCVLRGDASRLVSLIRQEGLNATTLIRLDQLITKVTVQGGGRWSCCIGGGRGFLGEAGGWC